MESVLLGIILSAGIGLAGWWLGALSASGVAGAVVVGGTTFGCGGWYWGALVVFFFVTSSSLSMFGRRRKADLDPEFAKGGRRDLFQVLANGGWCIPLAVAFYVEPRPWHFTAFVGVLAAATADTWATELGVLSPLPPRLITTGRRVPAGTSGAISLAGTGAAAAGGALIGMAGGAFWQLAGTTPIFSLALFALMGILAGLAGALVDSLLGATVQGIFYCPTCGVETECARHQCGATTEHRRGFPWVGNDLVNLAGTLAGGLIAATLPLLWT